VATILVGNNLANYATSLAIVLGAGALLTEGGVVVEIAAPVVFSPFLFVYGELFPKNMFFQAPSRLLRMMGPFLLSSAIVLLPITVYLWLLGKLIEKLLGQSPQHVQRRLARAELRAVFEHGHEVGVLEPAQQQLAEGLFTLANVPVSRSATPIGRVAKGRDNMDRDELVKLARRQHAPTLVIEEAAGQRRLLGYVRLVDLELGGDTRELPLRKFVDISQQESSISALMRLYDASAALGRVVDGRGRAVGIVSQAALTESMFHGAR
jgi:CBS domain containing-hemolysin-like protein